MLQNSHFSESFWFVVNYYLLLYLFIVLYFYLFIYNKAATSGGESVQTRSKRQIFVLLQSRLFLPHASQPSLHQTGVHRLEPPHHDPHLLRPAAYTPEPIRPPCLSKRCVYFEQPSVVRLRRSSDRKSFFLCAKFER